MTDKPMKIIIKFPNASRAVVTGRILPSTRLSQLRQLYDAERAINELTNLRCHIFVEEDESGGNSDPENQKESSHAKKKQV